MKGWGSQRARTRHMKPSAPVPAQCALDSVVAIHLTILSRKPGSCTLCIAVLGRTTTIAALLWAMACATIRQCQALACPRISQLRRGELIRTPIMSFSRSGAGPRLRSKHSRLSCWYCLLDTPCTTYLVATAKLVAARAEDEALGVFGFPWGLSGLAMDQMASNGAFSSHCNSNPPHTADSRERKVARRSRCDSIFSLSILYGLQVIMIWFETFWSNPTRERVLPLYLVASQCKAGRGLNS